MSKRDITLSYNGVPLVITVNMASPEKPSQQPRIWAIRVAGSKHDIGEMLAAGVFSEMERRIKGGHFEPVEEEIFEVPTGRVPA
jgi:hypothetical protein